MAKRLLRTVLCVTISLEVCERRKKRVEVEENYLGDSQYEKERFTDTYTEDFEDDENKADRFTDDYSEDFTD